jgi:hypothetical protein
MVVQAKERACNNLDILACLFAPDARNLNRCAEHCVTVFIRLKTTLPRYGFYSRAALVKFVAIGCNEFEVV